MSRAYDITWPTHKRKAKYLRRNRKRTIKTAQKN